MVLDFKKKEILLCKSEPAGVACHFSESVRRSPSSYSQIGIHSIEGFSYRKRVHVEPVYKARTVTREGRLLRCHKTKFEIS